jgi:predicted ribosome quality control (RQC) complex YloA/Tae2 family protein
MRRAIHHVELNEKLQQCFDLLDQITRTYRTYNVEYTKLVDAHPATMDAFFLSFERECMTSFKMFDEAKRDEITALFTKETEEKQKKLEEEALKKYEEEKRVEELKRIEEEKKNPGAAKGKAPPPAAKKPPGKGEPEKPPIDVPKLEVPKI